MLPESPGRCAGQAEIAPRRDPIAARVRLRAVPDDVAEAPDPVGSLPLELGQDRVEDLLRRQRLREALADTLEPVRAIRGVL